MTVDEIRRALTELTTPRTDPVDELAEQRRMRAGRVLAPIDHVAMWLALDPADQVKFVEQCLAVLPTLTRDHT